jgi:hypothetical protein
MAVFGYSSATSVLPGSSISFYLSTDVPGVMNLTIERIGTTSVSSTITTTLFTRSLPTTNPWEGFGWPVIEAMTCGCPAIGSNQGSLKEIVLESTFAPEPTDYREITNLCRYLLIDENYRQNIIAKGLKYVEKFSTNHMISQYLAVYQQLGLQL